MTNNNVSETKHNPNNNEHDNSNNDEDVEQTISTFLTMVSIPKFPFPTVLQTFYPSKVSGVF